MHIVVVHGWKKNEAEAAKIIAEALGNLVFEARQIIIGGGPVALAHYADPALAEALAVRLSDSGIPALVMDSLVVREGFKPFVVRRFVPGAQQLHLESHEGEHFELNYDEIDLLLLATFTSGQIQTTTSVTERKLSLGKTLLSGGVPMTKKVTTEHTLTSEDRDETLWVYAGEQAPVIFNRSGLLYDGFGEAMQMSRDLNFAHLRNELQRLAPRALYDDRLLKRAAVLHVLGKSLSPDTDLDLAFEILARCLRLAAESPSG